MSLETQPGCWRLPVGAVIIIIMRHLFPCPLLLTVLCLLQSSGPDKSLDKSKEPPGPRRTEVEAPEGDGAYTPNGVDSVERRRPQQSPSGRQASLPDAAGSSGMSGLRRPVSDPWLPGK